MSKGSIAVKGDISTIVLGVWSGTVGTKHSKNWSLDRAPEVVDIPTSRDNRHWRSNNDKNKLKLQQDA